MDDAAILALYCARDENALRETESAYGAIAKKIAFHITGSREDAEECLSDGLLRLWNAIPPASPENLGGYFVTTVRRIALNRREKAHAERRGGGQVTLAFEELSPCLAAKENPEQALDSLALREALIRFLAALPEEPRVYFVQRYWMCLPVAEIAKETGSTTGKVKMSLSRTRKKLRAYLEKEELL